MAQEYTARQKEFILDDEVLKFEVFLERFMNENIKDISFVDSAFGLLLKIHQQSLQGKYLTKTQACRLVRSRNPTVCQKYVEEAQKRGFIEITKDPDDARRQIVKPLPALLDFVNEHVVDVATNARQVTAIAASVDPLPTDNQLMSGFEIKAEKDDLVSRRQDREAHLRNYVGSFFSKFHPKRILGTGTKEA